jgi:hypothetical protein
MFTVAALTNAFESGNLMAIKRMKGQRVMIGGVVEKINNREIYLKTAISNDKGSVRCKLVKQYIAPPTQVGATITVQGTLDKREASGTIDLNDCVIIAAAVH